LTDIPNRRGFNERLDLEWGRAIRDKSSLGVLMIDIDHFKRYNDTFGHPQGDVLLQAIAVIFRQTLGRSTDYAARWGGEGFAVLLPGTDLGGALNIAERIRSSVENTAVPCADGSKTHVTVSIGVCSLSPVPGDQIDGFISEADKSLYLAKESGRNRVCSGKRPATPPSAA
jgi:diguanylate cyclase (GGDEF)-like protein